MKLRLSTRHLLALVVGAAITLGLVSWMQRRADHFRSEASMRLGLWMVEVGADSHGGSSRADHHLELARKYDEAARRPWLPVGVDPPEPEDTP